MILRQWQRCTSRENHTLQSSVDQTEVHEFREETKGLRQQVQDLKERLRLQEEKTRRTDTKYKVETEELLKELVNHPNADYSETSSVSVQTPERGFNPQNSSDESILNESILRSPLIERIRDNPPSGYSVR